MGDKLIRKSVICIEEVVSQQFDVYHSAEDEPLEIAQAKYNAGEFVLSPGEVTCRKAAVITPAERKSEWIEF